MREFGGVSELIIYGKRDLAFGLVSTHGERQGETDAEWADLRSGEA